MDQETNQRTFLLQLWGRGNSSAGAFHASKKGMRSTAPWSRKKCARFEESLSGRDAMTADP
jgi:hypothetical protein